MFHRRPLVVNQLRGENFSSLARLSALEGFSRGLLVGIVPLVTLEALGSKSAVSVVYFGASILTAIITLNLATLERFLQRRWLTTLSAVFLIVAAIVLWLATGPEIALGIGLRASAASIFTVCLSLYIMDYIDKREFRVMESRRMVYNGSAWLIGPVLGAWLWDHYSHSAPFLFSMAAALSMTLYFWRMRLGNHPVLKPATSSVVKPLKALPRFFSQKRLRIAYLISITRSAFWVALFIYGPIYVLEAGLPHWIGGALLSAVSGMLFISPVVIHFADRFGSRALIITGLCISIVGLICLGLTGAPKPIGLLFWFISAFGCIILDVLGNIPFMRSVKARERVAMTVVFTTWREGSELLTPALIALLLLFAPFWVFFFVLAGILCFTTLMSTYLPRRM